MFLDKGTIRGTFQFTVNLNANGTVTFQATTEYKGGTGACKGAKGSGHTTAMQDGEGYATFEYTQTLKLPKR